MKSLGGKAQPASDILKGKTHAERKPDLHAFSTGQALRITWLHLGTHSPDHHIRILPQGIGYLPTMEKPELGKLVICSIVVFLGTLAFSCSVAAEFKKVKAKDMKLDGSLCSLPRSSAFGLGIAAVVCLSIAQIVVTSAVLCIRPGGGDNMTRRRTRIVSITLLVSSWISFGSAMILLATGSSMNGGQTYGKGWMDGNCYIVRNGVFLGAAVLVVTTVASTLGFTYATTHQRTRPDEGGRDHHQQRKVFN